MPFCHFNYLIDPKYWDTVWGWLGGAKVLCILHHWGVQLILAYSWARPAILVVGKGRGGMFLFLLFLHFHSCSSFFPVPLFHLLYSLFLSLFSLSLGDNTKWPSRVDVSLNPNTIKNWDTVVFYHTFPKGWTKSIYWLLMCLFGHVCSDTQGNYGNLSKGKTYSQTSCDVCILILYYILVAFLWSSSHTVPSCF